MKKIFLFSSIIIFTLFSCKEKAVKKDTRFALRSDTLNTVKLSDTLVIFEGTCRGCEYENSTNFDIEDTTKNIQLLTIITIDNNPPDMAGGSVGKEIELVPTKTGKVNLKLYKFWTEEKTAEDSGKAITYQIEVIN
jgi:hypothetical protein